MATITMEGLCKNGEPTGNVGDGATILYYTDTEPATIIASTAKTITVQIDKETITGGTWPDFTYSYAPDPGGATRKFFWSPKRGWGNGKSGNRLLVGTRRYYRDPTF